MSELVAPAVGGPDRRRAWWRAGCVLLAVVVYLSVWTTYAIYGLADYGRFAQQPPGATVTSMDADFTLVSLVQTTQVTNAITDEIVRPAPNAVWVVARIDVVRHAAGDSFFCDFQVLGPDRRVWGPAGNHISRDTESLCLTEMAVGPVHHREVIFEIPERYVGDLAGVVVNDPVSRAARPVLVPPA